MSLFGIKEKEKIVELNTLIDSLQKEIIKRKGKEEELFEAIQEKDKKINSISKSPHDRQFEKITLEFDKVKKENTTLKISNENFKLENMELISKNRKIIEQIIEIEKIVECLKEENKTLKQSKKPEIIKQKSRYKVLIKDLYSARKHDEFKKIIENLGLIYVSELEHLNFEKLMTDGISKTKINNAKNEYTKFKNGEFSSDIEKYLVHGHRVSKIFFRYRSFVSLLTNMGIEFFYQLENFDFEVLKEEKFTPTQVEKLKEKITEYNKLRKI